MVYGNFPRQKATIVVRLVSWLWAWKGVWAFTGDIPVPFQQHGRQRQHHTLLTSSTDRNSGSGSLYPNVSRRQAAELAFAAIGLGTTYLGTRESTPQDYGLWGILPVGTYKQKKTIRETIVPDQIWTFDQKFGILDVQVPLRMT